MRLYRLLIAFVLIIAFHAPVVRADERTDRLKTLVGERALAEGQKNDSNRASPATPPSSEISGIRVIEGLFLTLGVFFIGVWGYQKLNKNAMPKTSSRRMKLVERITVGPKTALVLAEIDGRSVLMSVGSERVAFFSDSAWLEGAWEKEQEAQQSVSA